MVFFFSFFLFLFYSFYLRLTYKPPPQPNCHDDNNTHGPQDMKGGDGDEETGPKWRNRVSLFVPLVHFFFSFFLILFTIRTRDASYILGLFFFITTSNNGLETCQNASQDSLPLYLPWRAWGAWDVSKRVSRSPPFFPTSCKHKAWDASWALFYFFFSFHLHKAQDVSWALFSFFFFLFSFFFFLFSFFFFLFLSFYSTDYYLQVFFFKYLNFNTWMMWVGHKRARDASQAQYVYSFFLQSDFFLLKIIYIEITYGHKHERLHHPYYKDEGLNDTSRCVVWAKSRFFFNSLGFLHIN